MLNLAVNLQLVIVQQNKHNLQLEYVQATQVSVCRSSYFKIKPIFTVGTRIMI